LVVTALAKAIRRALGSLVPDGTLITTDLLSSDNQAEISEVERLQAENFIPRQDVKKQEFRHWLSHYEETFGFPMRVILAKVDDQIRGFLMFHESVQYDLIAIDYLACDATPAVHGMLFRKMIEQVRMVARASGIGSVVFEAEDPAGLAKGDDIRRAEARIHKFQSYGARIIDGLRYLAPDMETFGVIGAEEPYLLMHSAVGAQPPSLRAERVREILEFMYKVWYRNWFSLRFKNNLPKLSAYIESVHYHVTSRSSDQQFYPLTTLPD
jgi:hypothetical protein